MKISTFNAHGSRVIVKVRVMKIYVATMEMIKKMERHDETQFPTKLVAKPLKRLLSTLPKDIKKVGRHGSRPHL